MARVGGMEMAEKAEKWKSVKLPAALVEEARVVSAMRRESLSGYLVGVLARRVEEDAAALKAKWAQGEPIMTRKRGKAKAAPGGAGQGGSRQGGGPES